VNQGEVTLNLSAIVDDVASRLGLPSNISSHLPPSVARLTVFKAKQLKLVQDIGNAVQGLALALTIVVPLLYILALVLAHGRRRRTLMNVGFAIALVGVIGLAIRALLKSYVTNQLVKDEAFRPAVHAVLDIMTQILGAITVGFLFVGIVAVIAAWFAGPAHPAVVSRRWLAPFLRDHPYWTYAVVAFVLLLIFIWQPFPATGTLIGIIVFTVLAAIGTEALRRQTAEEFPEGGGGGGAPPAAPATS
jgi:MFS family permease